MILRFAIPEGSKKIARASSSCEPPGWVASGPDPEGSYQPTLGLKEAFAHDVSIGLKTNWSQRTLAHPRAPDKIETP